MGGPDDRAGPWDGGDATTTYRDGIAVSFLLPAKSRPEGPPKPPSAAARLGQRYPLVLIAMGVLLYSTGPVMLQSSGVSGPAFSFWRLWIGAVALGGLALVRGLRSAGPVLPTGEGRRLTLLGGAAFGVHQLMFMTATKMTSVVDVSLMNALAPVVTALGAWWLFRERPGARFFGWSALAIGGGAFLAVSAAGPTGDPLGMALAIGNVIFFAGFFLASKRSRDHVSVLPFLAGVMVVAAVLVSGFVLVTGTDVAAASRTDILLAAGVALGPGTLGHFVMTWPLRWVPANIPPVMRLAQPALAGGLAFLILGEPLALTHLLGGIVVVVGAAGAVLSRDGRALRRDAAAQSAHPSGEPALVTAAPSR